MLKICRVIRIKFNQLVLKMSVLSLCYWESDVYWRQNNKQFAELAAQNGGKQLVWRNYVIVTLCLQERP